MSERKRLAFDESTLCRAIRLQPGEDEIPQEDFDVEMMGDAAFDWLVTQLESHALAPSQAGRAFQLLARLARMLCVNRKGEFLDLAVRWATNSMIGVEERSVAAFMAGMGAKIAMGFTPEGVNAAYARNHEEIITSVVAALRRALDLGLNPDQEHFVREFLLEHRERR